VITGEVAELTIEDGSVVDDSTAAIRRTLTLTLPPTEAFWQLLDTVGGEITVTKTMVYPTTSETIPIGVFIVDQDQIGYSPGDTLQLTCPDRWLRVSRAYLSPADAASKPSNMAWQEIKRLVEGAWPSGKFPGWSQLDTSATTKVGSLVYDDRPSGIAQLATDNALDVFFDRNGLCVLRRTPTLSTSSIPVWAFDAGASGVLIEADRTRDRSTVKNQIVVTTSATDITMSPVTVQNTTAGDPLSVFGPLGIVSEDYSSPTIRNTTQARAAGLVELSKTLGSAQQLNLESVPNFALDSLDVVQALLPQTDMSLPRAIELHILDSVTTPLVPSGTQQSATRATRPITDGS
jgi:hypothetical protein